MNKQRDLPFSCRTSPKMPSSPHLAHKAPVMQAIHFFVCMLSFLTDITFYYFNRAIRLISINMILYYSADLIPLDWTNHFANWENLYYKLFYVVFSSLLVLLSMFENIKKKIMISLPRHTSLSSYWRKFHCCKSWF